MQTFQTLPASAKPIPAIITQILRDTEVAVTPTWLNCVYSLCCHVSIALSLSSRSTLQPQ